jgi:prepilin-type N-terminal cleavage/methylation domain-containing protein
MKRRLKILNNQGMTLTEILVALALLALLIAVFAPFFARQISLLVEAGQYNENAMENAYRLEQGLAENRISPYTRLVPVKYLNENLERSPVRGWMIEEGEYTTFVAYDAYISNGPFALIEGYGPKGISGKSNPNNYHYIFIKGSGSHFANGKTQYKIRDKDGMIVDGAGVFADVLDSYEAYIGLRTSGNGVLTADGSPYTIEIITPDVFKMADGSTQEEVLYTQISVGQPMYLAAGDSGKVFISSDPAFWISDPRLPNISFHIYASAYKKDMYVVGGQNGNIYYRVKDGTWQKAVTPPGKNKAVRAIVYSEELSVFIAVGDGGQILRSVDGKNWTSPNSSTSRDLTAVSYGNGTFVAIGASGTVLRSSDGLSWTATTLRYSNSNITINLTDITFKYNKFIAVGESVKSRNTYNAYLWYTDNGTTWDRVTVINRASTNVIFQSIGWNDTYFLIGQTDGKIRYSDGLKERDWWLSFILGPENWQEISVTNSGVTISSAIRDIAWADDYFFAVTDGGRILLSPNGISDWNVIETGGGTLHTVATW